jgi:hypothetical protein
MVIRPSGFNGEASGFGLQASGFRLQASGFRLQGHKISALAEDHMGVQRQSDEKSSMTTFDIREDPQSLSSSHHSLRLFFVRCHVEPQMPSPEALRPE